MINTNDTHSVADILDLQSEPTHKQSIHPIMYLVFKSILYICRVDECIACSTKLHCNPHNYFVLNVHWYFCSLVPLWLCLLFHSFIALIAPKGISLQGLYVPLGYGRKERVRGRTKFSEGQIFTFRDHQQVVCRAQGG